MAGRVVLHSDDTYTLQHPDSKRPQAVRKMWKPHCRRVACAERRRSRHCRPGCVREVERKRHCGLSGLSSRCGGVVLTQIPIPAKSTNVRSTHLRLQNPGTRKDLTGSDLWPVRSCCTAMLPMRSNVQTRAAPKRRGVGLTRAKRSGRRHCRLRRFRCGDGSPWALQPAWAASASARRFRRRR